MDKNNRCQAIFEPIPKLTLTVDIDGKGAVSSTPAGISCNSDDNPCTHEFDIDQAITLIPKAVKGWEFQAWEGQCDVDGNVTMGTDKTCQASFAKIPTLTLTLNTNGTGNGTVNGTGTYEIGTNVTIEAIPDANSQFIGWNQTCQDGQVTLIADTTCTATFTHIDKIPIEQDDDDDDDDSDGDDKQNLSPGYVQFSPNDYTQDEWGNVITISVARIEGSDGILMVTYASEEHTAKADNDYQATQGTLTWMDGEMGEKTFAVSIINDTEIEGNETFRVILQDTNNNILDTNTVIIIDDETTYAPPILPIDIPINVLPPTKLELIGAPKKIGITGAPQKIEITGAPQKIEITGAPQKIGITGTPLETKLTSNIDWLPKLAESNYLDSTGTLKPSPTLFYGGIQIVDKNTGFMPNATLTQTNTIAIIASMKIVPEHINQIGEIIVLVQYVEESSNTSIYFYQQSQGEWVLWNNKDITNLAPTIAPHPLEPVEIIDIYNGKLINLLGNINIFFGYRLETGEIHFAEIPIIVK